MPFLKNRHFVGRREELAVLRQRLLAEQDCQKMSIVGLGGTGKTQVALHFAYEVKEAQPEWSIFWVAAVSMESFEQACAGIVQALHIPKRGNEDDAKELVKQYLSSGQARQWLLVVDNADDPDILFGSKRSLGIVDYLPESEGGVTVYTTRTLEVAVSLTRGDVLELGAMGRGDATDFLSKSLVQKKLLADQAMTDRLLDELTCLPLAIAQAAAYLNMNQTNIAKYLWLLHNTEQDLVGLMSEDFRDDTRYKGSANAVATTWVVSFSQLRERDVVAANLLKFMSCIEWKAVPRSLLPSVHSEVRMEKAIGTLCGYSFLVRRDSDNSATSGESKQGGDANQAVEAVELYDIHRLVHLATRVWVREYGDAKKVAEDAVRHVADVFPSDDHKNRALWRAYLPHALRLLEGSQAGSAEELSELCLLVGRCLRVDGRIREAVVWLERSCQQDDSDRLLSQHVLAMAYEADGQVKKAVALLEAVVEAQETLAADHPDRLASQHALAMAYRADGQVKKAVALLEAVVEAEETLAADHPDQLASQHALAMAYRADGQVKKAVALLEAVVKAEETLAADHPDRLASQHELAMTYRADGQVKKAVALLEAVVEAQETLAADHPSRLASQHELAGAYRADGQVKKAVTLLEPVVKAKETLAGDHPSRLASQHELAMAYRADGQMKKAVALLEAVVEVRNEVLAADHPDRLASQHALAGAYRADGQVKKAVALLEAVVEVRNEVLAADHPDQLASQHELAMAYEADGQVKKAVALLEAVVKAKETLAADHPSRLVSQHELAGVYQADGQRKRAIELLEDVVAVEAISLRDDHPLRLASVEALADMRAELAIESDEASSPLSLESPMIADCTGFVRQ
jgi:tetratricopeptide (TPR) repeat protein